MDAKPQISLSNFLLLTVVVLLAVLYTHQRRRANQLENALLTATDPVIDEIQRLESSVSKRELALNYSKRLVKLNQATAANPKLRREFANIRNAQLKLDREKSRLTALKFELKKITNPQDE